MSTVYLLHFDAPIAHAQHYLGYTTNLSQRLAMHANGNGARLTQVCLERHISWRLARTWTGGRNLERKLKNQKHSARLCPICQQEKLHEQ